MKVFYICSYANDVFYVRAENPEKAEEILRREIAKYIFQRNLKDKAHAAPKMLGKNIIVEFNISKDTLDKEFTIEDITATAYIFASNGREHWDNWDIEIADAIGNKDVSDAIEDMIDDITKENV